MHKPTSRATAKPHPIHWIPVPFAEEEAEFCQIGNVYLRVGRSQRNTWVTLPPHLLFPAPERRCRREEDAKAHAIPDAIRAFRAALRDLERAQKKATQS